MNNFQNQNLNNQQQPLQTGFNTQTQPANQQVNQQQPSIIMKLMNSCLPVLLEQFMGQSIPPMGGNSVEIQLALSQIITLQQQLLTNQQSFNQRLIALESNASQQLTNLTQQVQSIKSIRLSHEKKQIEFNSQSEQAN